MTMRRQTMSSIAVWTFASRSIFPPTRRTYELSCSIQNVRLWSKVPSGALP